MEATCRIPAIRSSTSPSRPDCTSSTPAIIIASATALKKMICHESPEIRRRGIFAVPPRSDGPCPVSAFPVTVTDTIERLDGVEIIIDSLEFLAQPFDVAVDRAIVDIDLIVVSRVHQIIAAFYESRPLCEVLQDQECRQRKAHRVGIPCTLVALRIEYEFSTHQHFALGLVRRRAVFAGVGAAEHGLHT